MTSTLQNSTGLDMEHMEVLKKSYDDFEKRQEAESYGVAAPNPVHLVPILSVLPGAGGVGLSRPGSCWYPPGEGRPGGRLAGAAG